MNLQQAKIQLTLTRKAIELASKGLFIVRNHCAGDYDKIFQIDDMIKDISRTNVNTIKLVNELTVQLDSIIDHKRSN